MSSSAASAQWRSSIATTVGVRAASALRKRGQASPISSATDSGVASRSVLPGSVSPALAASADATRCVSAASIPSGASSSRDEPGQLAGGRGDAVVEQDTGRVPQDLAQRPVGDALPVGQAAPAVHGAAGLDRHP